MLTLTAGALPVTVILTDLQIPFIPSVGFEPLALP
jgi:hypothetical protein